MISLWFLLFSLIISFFSKRDTLNCGLWAWSGSNVSLFNIDKFNILGFFNDDRGGDSSGRFMDRVVEKGIDKNADYKELVKVVPTIMPKENTVVIGHARKASVGAKTIENTQPFLIYDPVDKNGAGKPKVLGVFMHNGTITNMKDLCEKYDKPYDKDLSDSYHLGLLIFTVGVNILEEYIGSAACMWIPWNNRNSLFAFRGESKLTRYAQTTTEERPMWIYKHVTSGGSSYYLSSIMNSLESAFQVGKDDKEQVLYLKTNVVYRIFKDKLYNAGEIDRSNLVYDEPKTTPAAPVIPFRNHWYNKHEYESIPTRKHILWIAEEQLNLGKDRVTFYRSRYYVNYTLANGVIKVNRDGFLSETGKELYFIYGVLIRNEADYIEALNTVASNAKPYPYIDFIDDIMEYTDSPVSQALLESAKSMGYAKIFDPKSPFTSRTGWEFFTGTFCPYFSSRRFTFNNGDCLDITHGVFNSYDDDITEAIIIEEQIEEKVEEEAKKDDTPEQKMINFEKENIIYFCDAALNKVLDVIKEANETIESLVPRVQAVIQPYISALDDAENCIYDIPDFEEKPVTEKIEDTAHD